MAGTYVLFGASWCAPCRAELARLPQLAAAAIPQRLELAWTDRAPPVNREVPPNVRILNPRAARIAYQALAADLPGLPVTVLIDTAGRRCAVLREPLSVAGIEQLRRACR